MQNSNYLHTATTAAALMLSFLASPAFAANENDWENVRKLSPGTKVEVIHHGLKQMSGTLTATTADSLTIQEAGSSTGTTVGVADVTRVSTARGSRKKHTLIGMAIGAGATAALFAIGASTGDIDIRRDIVVGGGAAIGAAAGAGIGAALPTAKVIYRAPKP
jgi:hypothetical protein